MAWFEVFWNLPTSHALQPSLDEKVPELQLFVTQDARVFVAGTVGESQVLLHVACPIWSLYLPGTEHKEHAPPASEYFPT
jgi:hypothetical protein